MYPNAKKTHQTADTKRKGRKTRKNITLATKLEIIRRLERGQSNSSISLEFNLPSSTVSTIRAKKEQIKAFCQNSVVQDKCYQITYPRNNVIEELELTLLKWMNQQNFNFEQVKYLDVKEKALELFEAIKAHSKDQNIDAVEFKASHGWFDRFRRRFTRTSNNETNNQPTDLSINNFIQVDPPSSDLSSVSEPITVIEEEQTECPEVLQNDFESDVTDLFWGKIISSIFSLDNCKSPELDAKSLALVFKLSEGIVSILETHDPDTRRRLEFKQNLTNILHPYRQIYNQKLLRLKDKLGKI